MSLKTENRVNPEVRLGELLISRGLIRQDQLDTALREQTRSKKRLGEILISLGFLDPKNLYPLLGWLFHIPFVDLDVQLIPDELHSKATPEYIPFKEDQEGVHIAMGDPHDVFILQSIQQNFLNPRIYIADPASIIRHAARVSSKTSYDSRVSVSHDSIVDLAQDILAEGIRRKVSDIHFLPQEKTTNIFVRQDGLLHEMNTLHQPQWAALKSHFKILAQLDLAENRRPQDGRMTMNHPLGAVDCRLSFIPTYQGESLVIRLLDPTRIQHDLPTLGFLEEQCSQLYHMTQQSQGLFIIAGPTGSGKTTTLYALLKHLKYLGKNIVTVEDPIEYCVEGIRQSEVQRGINTFGELLRALLRHDPDVMYISEIRDAETAQTAVRAAMTGHLVFSTVHANDACLIPQRLRDLGVSLSDLSGTLLGLMSQRLIRQKCSCSSDLSCEQCYGGGYYGRRVLAEILPCDLAFRSLCGEDLSWLTLQEWRSSLKGLKYEEIKRIYLQNNVTDAAELARVFGSDPYEPFRLIASDAA